MQRIGDERRGEDLVDGDDVAHERVLVVLGVQRRRDLDLGQLRARRAELVHVALRGECVVADDVGTPQVLELALRRGADGATATGARSPTARVAGEGDQRHVDLAGGNGGGSVPDVHQVRGTAALGRIDVATSQAEVLGHRDPAEAGRVASAEVRVDVADGQAGIGQRADGDIGMDLRDRASPRDAQRVLIRAGDVSLPPDRHARHRSAALAAAAPSLSLRRCCRTPDRSVGALRGARAPSIHPTLAALPALAALAA